MARIWLLCVLAHAISGMAVPDPVKVGSIKTPPLWSVRYQVSGTLRLPYAQIEEPFVGWYDATKNRSRVDFYGGMFTVAS